MRQLSHLLLVVAAGCGSGRDPGFYRIVQFSAVDKLQLADKWVYLAEDDGLKRVEKAGGKPLEVVYPGTVVDFAAVPGHLYAATPSGVVHFSIAAAGTVSAPTPVSPDNALAIAADKNGVSWVTCTALTHAAP